MESKPLRFIGEPVEAHFDVPPVLEKRPGCPSAFTWREQIYRVTEVLAEWQDFTRRGRMASNMRPSHAATAARRGSWGVGRTFYRVRVDSGQIFELYYDRAPKGVDNRKGSWNLLQELA